MTLTIAELPFVERPVIELLALDVDRDAPDRDYAGYGYAKLDRVMLVDAKGRQRVLEDALLIAVHSADDGEVQADDVELELDLPEGERKSVTVLASRFLEIWLPKLPAASAIVLVMCNPHRARLAKPPWPVPIHYALGDVESWRDLDDPRTGIRLVAATWCTLGDVTTELARRDKAIDDETKQSLAGIYLMKKLDLKPEDGGMELPVVLPSELSPIDEVLQELAVEDYVVINAKKERWDLTKKGLSRLKNLIDEAEEIYDAMDELEEEQVPAYLAQNRLDPVRTRFLWGWYEGELDDLVQFQEQRGLRPVERMWAFYLMGDDLWRELAKDVEVE